jgi:hypothetical protein
VSKWLTIKGIRHQAAIAGQVSDAQTGAAISGVQVHISAGPETFQKGLALKARQYGENWEALPERPDRACTAADGYYRFINLPPGDYMLTASLPGRGTRYGQAQASASVVYDDQGNIALATADLQLAPTTLLGQVRDAGGEPVHMVQVRVLGGGEYTFSDEQGQYRLTGLEAGGRQVRASAQGYAALTQAVQLEQAGGQYTLNFSLTRG